MGALGRRVGALAVAAVAFAAAACSKTENLTAPGVTGAPGVVRIVGVNSIDSLVPELSGNASSSDIAMFWGAWLFRVGAHGELVPELALRVPTLANGGISADGRTITYALRKGVRWHDGAPFDARDVIFTWHAIMNPRNNVLTRTGYDKVVSMIAPDPYTVVVRLREPYAPAIATFFGPSLAPMCILPRHILGGLPDINRAAYDAKPIGTGPFVVERYDTQTAVRLRANPSYWRGPPKLQEVDFLIAPDSNTRALMMRTGEADLFYQPPNNLVGELQAIPGVRTIDSPYDEFWYIGFNTTHPPLDDARVRRALAMGVDRDLVVRSLAHGLGTPAQGDQPAYSWAYDPGARAPRFDPDAAAALLARAGWIAGPDGFRYKGGKRLSFTYVTSSGYTEGKNFAPVFQQEMKRLGVEIAARLYPTSLLFAAKSDGGIMNNGKYDIVWSGWIGGVDPDDTTLWSCDQRPPNGFNQSWYCDPRIDAQERIAVTSYDQETRRRAYWRIQELLDEDVPVDFLFWTRNHDAMRAGLRNYRPAPTVTNFSNPWEWQM